jgi:hypothetical protein
MLATSDKGSIFGLGLVNQNGSAPQPNRGRLCSIGKRSSHSRLRPATTTASQLGTTPTGQSPPKYRRTHRSTTVWSETHGHTGTVDQQHNKVLRWVAHSVVLGNGTLHSDISVETSVSETDIRDTESWPSSSPKAESPQVTWTRSALPGLASGPRPLVRPVEPADDRFYPVGVEMQFNVDHRACA